jgi:CBS-domain-containing membrane protein
MSDFGARLSRAAVRWRVADSKFRHNKRQYLLQTLLVVLTMTLVLLVLDKVEQTVLIASLGASAFIAFAMPRSYQSRPRYLIGGYCIGTAVGCLLSLLSLPLAAGFGLDSHSVQIVCAALASGLAFFLMVLTDTEHPPAAALALGYVLNEWHTGTVMVVLAGVVALTMVKQLFRSRLMDLV